MRCCLNSFYGYCYFCIKCFKFSSLAMRSSSSLIICLRYGTIDLALIECKEIPADGLNGLMALKSISLSDVTTLGERALFNCVNLKTVNAPKVTAIDQLAFFHCQRLKEVTLGTLTDVRGEANSGSGIFDDVLSSFTDLYLPENQEIMQGEFDENSNQYIWKPTGESYFAGPNKDNGIFLGYQFMSVKKWE